MENYIDHVYDPKTGTNHPLIGRMLKVTYAELKALRDGGALIPGAQYRITDYECTVDNSGLAESVKSAGHVFDVIVTADSENKLSEFARAINHEGDTYFSECNLAAWKLWYCLDNDDNRFAWAKYNGKGVIYRMIDEHENDFPYDFKNVIFIDPQKPDYTYMEGEFYTFSCTVDGNIKDASVIKNAICHHNKKRFVTNSFEPDYTLALSETVFYSEGSVLGCANNSIGTGACYILIGMYSYCNSIGDNCNHIMIQEYSTLCNIRDFNSGITIGTESSKIYIGNYSDSITIGDHSNFIHIDQQGASISIGNYCSNIFIKDYCNNIQLGSYYSDILLNGDNSYIRFGTSNDSIINYVRRIEIGAATSYLNIASDDTSASASNYLQNVEIDPGIFGDSNANRLSISVPDRKLVYKTTYIKEGSNEVVIP